MIKKLYKIWIRMKNKCYNPNDNRYHCYGGKGIKICEEWKNNYYAFEKWSLENGYKYIPRKDGTNSLSIDRINNDGDYEPDNCRWTSSYEQAMNRSTNHLLEIDGVIKPLKRWADEYNLTVSGISCRLKRGIKGKDLLKPLKNYTKFCKKHIIQKDLQGNFIKEWKSFAEIERSIGKKTDSISRCCRKFKNYNTAHGYIWEYKKED